MAIEEIQRVGSRTNSSHPHNHERQTSEAPRRPQFSLAGSYVAPAPAPSYIDPEYYDLNPKYNQPVDKPIWGLARPLPRVVRTRSRMRSIAPREGNLALGGRHWPNLQRLRTSKNIRPLQTNTEPIPQVARIHSQRADDGDDEHRFTGNPKHRDGAPPMMHTASKEEANVFSRYGSPAEEKGDPMNSIRLPPSKSRQDSGTGDVGEQFRPGLSAVVEESPNNSELDLEARAGLKLTPSKDESVVEEIGRDEDDSDYEMVNQWSLIRARFREPLAEGLATFVYILVLLCANLSAIISSEVAGYESANWASGLGIMLGIYIAGGISGAHLNPAISLVLCLFRGFPMRKAAIYITAQCFGAFLASLIAYGIYRDGILAFDGGTLNANRDGSGKAFLTGVMTDFGNGAGFTNEFVATGILAGAILALGDDANAPPGAGMHALIVGLVVVLLGMAFSYPTGACLNPARDFGPRLAALAVGYGKGVFTADNGWWIWGGWAATISGALTGGFIYDAFVFVGSESPVNHALQKKRKKKIQDE